MTDQEDFLEDAMDEIIGRIDSDSSIDIRNIDALKEAHESSALHFNRLYVARNGRSSASPAVVGVLEKLYDYTREEERNFMAVLYRRMDGVDCDTANAWGSNNHYFVSDWFLLQKARNAFLCQRNQSLASNHL